eukprot:m.93716 g.93716  ORF g.93716 m.93716 type:complete len:466 (+) comp13407_c0_seq3:250-1647(+)
MGCAGSKENKEEADKAEDKVQSDNTEPAKAEASTAEQKQDEKEEKSEDVKEGSPGETANENNESKDDNVSKQDEGVNKAAEGDSKQESADSSPETGKEEEKETDSAINEKPADTDNGEIDSTDKTESAGKDDAAQDGSDKSKKKKSPKKEKKSPTKKEKKVSPKKQAKAARKEKLKEAKKEKKGKGEKYIEDGNSDLGEPRKHKMSISVSAFMNQTMIEIEEEELSYIESVHKGAGDAFSVDELRRLYADFKMNGFGISREEFRIIWATYSRTGNSDAFADKTFNMSPRNERDHIGFENFIAILSVMMKGDAEMKCKFSFQLFDPTEDGCITHERAVDLISRLPLRDYFLEGESDNLDSRSETSRYSGHPLAMIGEVDEDAEEEIPEEIKLQRQISAESDYKTIKDFKAASQEIDEPSELQVKKAQDIVAKAYGDLGKKFDQNLTFGDYMLLCEASQVADYFAPL